MQARKRVCISFVFRYKHLFFRPIIRRIFLCEYYKAGRISDLDIRPAGYDVLLNQPIRSSVRKRSPDGGAGCC